MENLFRRKDKTHPQYLDCLPVACNNYGRSTYIFMLYQYIRKIVV